jgi:hypothetical protein
LIDTSERRRVTICDDASGERGTDPAKFLKLRRGRGVEVNDAVSSRRLRRLIGSMRAFGIISA